MNTNAAKNHWIAVDWGTTNLRMWLMDGDTAIEKRCSDRGMSSVSGPQFRETFDDLAGDWTDLADTAVACGMVGSRQGWVEAKYCQVPCPPLSNGFVVAEGQIPVHVISGLCQRDPDDVMRGEETQIAGFLTDRPNWTGALCLPGTHTKWALIQNGQVTSFRTSMTGDVFAAMTSATVLQHSTATKGWDNAAFVDGMDLGYERPQTLLADLFSIRARNLLSGDTAEASRARLSGMLIGAELAGMTDLIAGDTVALIGDGPVADLYDQALSRIGKTVIQTDNDTCTLRGLTTAYYSLGD